MPIFSVKMMNHLAKLCGCSVTSICGKDWQPCRRGDVPALLKLGIDFAFEQCKELIAAGVPGLHFYTMDRSQSTIGVLARSSGGVHAHGGVAG